MKNSLIFLICSTALLGCATQGKITEQKTTPEQYYRVSGYEKALVIKGTLEKIANPDAQINQVLKVYINDQLAINEVLVNDDDELRGRWKKHKVSAACYRDTRSERCLIYVGNERTVTLSF
jgi:hypothetical protein